jgi:putative PIN family toxin of toxin-antitoxin system
MEKYKVIIDTNLWISLLIGKRLSEMHTLCNSNIIDVYICDELKEEFMRIAFQKKIRKYATDERVIQTLELMEASCILSFIGNAVVLSDLRDVNDLYLLALAETVEADFILTGDKDLLSLQFHHQTKIITYKKFETIIRNL